MSASRVVLWRHGQTDMNLTGRIQGARDFPLNEAGLRQAREAAAALAPLEPSLIVSSPLARARQTAEALSRVVGVDVETDDRLKERSFGLFEGLTGAEIEERFPEQYRAWRQAKEPEGVGAAIKLATISLLGEAPGQWMGLKVMSNCNWAILEPLRVGPPAWRIAAYNVGVGKSDEVRTPTQ